MKTKTLLTIGILTSALIGLAEKSAIAQSQPNCRNPQTQIEMNVCAAESAKAADRRLNQVYQKIRANYKGTPREPKLVDAQLDWIKFRDTNCAFSRSRFEGGSIAPLVYHSCIERLTKQRTQELESYLEEGAF